ncbi:hypothetical protein [Cellvibrio sp. QJXJ]|uniref:hypothetical protein n=1 Tax=Cellvibrio sp. QJXJ TaxID=2964606 RepID=UPI0021C47C77|nr:hypothetical protein [Cellvibrio sp. QJXJ]UUA75168.1 hypothetical protein NNX04_22180 [Cellvibrio sp. QJXJ]
MTIAQAQSIVSKAVKLITNWEAHDRYKTKDSVSKLKELEAAVCTHQMAKAMRICARPDLDNAMSQAEAAAIIFKTAKSWQRWENHTSPISLGDICHFLLATQLMEPISRD